jgi:hypothetical protein
VTVGVVVVRRAKYYVEHRSKRKKKKRERERSLK